MTEQGEWADTRGPDDAHGRALWGLGRSLAGPNAELARPALIAGLDLDSHYPRANAYATLGAAAALEAEPDLPGITAFLTLVSTRLPRVEWDGWGWPEPRLTYDNARVPQALVAAGLALGDDTMVGDGLRFLGWLIEIERNGTGFSFTPVGGREPRQRGPEFDQQPIEAWGMADACLLAAEIDGSGGWAGALEDAAMWVMGRNDTGAALYDPETGAGFDGLEREGVNQNRGAESTLAALGALDALRRKQENTVR
jgi:hypothetical protein